MPPSSLQEVWIALRASEREILELVSIADVAGGNAAGPGTGAVRRPDGVGLSQPFGNRPTEVTRGGGAVSRTAGRPGAVNQPDSRLAPGPRRAPGPLRADTSPACIGPLQAEHTISASVA